MIEPEYTCPTIDEVVTGLEKLRIYNRELRDWGNQGWLRVAELELELYKSNENINE